MKEITKNIIELVRECGQFIKNVNRDHILIDSKQGRQNFVTEYDKKVQEKLFEGLMKIVPDAHFLGEEGEGHDFSESGKYFIVDPIDGTTNFIKDYHNSSISVALVEDGEAIIGVIYNPYLDEVFYAEKGKGSFMNGKPIRVSSHPLSEGLVIFGTSPYNEQLSKKSFELAYEYFNKSMDIRRSGSAAIDLCSVACGRAELFFELSLAPWDHAAGGLIIQEAGGIITTMEGNKTSYYGNCSILARNKD